MTETESRVGALANLLPKTIYWWEWTTHDYNYNKYVAFFPRFSHNIGSGFPEGQSEYPTIIDILMKHHTIGWGYFPNTVIQYHLEAEQISICAFKSIATVGSRKKINDAKDRDNGDTENEHEKNKRFCRFQNCMCVLVLQIVLSCPIIMITSGCMMLLGCNCCGSTCP